MSDYPYQTMPALDADTRDALERSIREYGIQSPIVVDENGEIIDGHHRASIAVSLGISCPRVQRSDLTEAQKVALSISLNVDRRQLTSAQKREVVAASLKAEPEASNREHARRVGVSDKTVDAVRDALVESAEIPHISERRDPRTGNASQPASKPAPVVNIKTKETHTSETTETVDQSTGEVIEPTVRAAVAAAIESDQTVIDAKYMHAFYQAITKADDFLAFDADRIGRLATNEDFVSVEQFLDGTERFLAKMRAAGSGLRLVGGSK